MINHNTDKLVNKSFTQDDLKNAISNVAGDIMMDCPTVQFAEHLATHSQTKNHFYSYRLMQNFTSLMLPSYSWSGVTHGTDLWYLFYIPLISSNVEAMKLSGDMIRTWTNFAKNGQPGKLGEIEWDSAFKANDRTNFVELKWNHYKMTGNYYAERCDKFW